MAILQKEIQNQIDTIIDEAYNEFSKNNHKKSFLKLSQALELIPEPKEYFGESFNVIKYIIEDYLTLKDIQNAKLWSNKIFVYGKNRVDSGEKELLMGKVFFESKEYDTALEYFSVAFEKSSGREFEGEDPKYLELIKHPGNILKAK